MKSCQLKIILLILLQIQEQDAYNNCGKRLISHNALITRGVETSEGDWPWHAAIFHRVNFNPKYMCGGAVITTNSVLTAAHCLHESGRRIISDKILVDLGTHNLFFGSHVQRFEAYQLIPHPEYNTTNLNNDIAIIRLKTEATFNNYVQPICLWFSSNSDITGRSGIVIGWGKTEDNQPSHILREVSLPVVGHSTCRSSNTDFFNKYLTDNNFCAGFENGASLCNGDSGGSLSFEENGVYYIRGIVSLTSSRKDKDFCNSKDYVIFTDIAQYLPWIENEAPQPRPQHTPQPLPRSNLQHRPKPNLPTEMDFTPLPNEQSCSENFGLNNIGFSSRGGFSMQPFMNNHHHHSTSFGWRRKRDVGVEHCCNLCKDHGGCQGYEWTDANGGICRLKSGNGETIRIIGQGTVSGHGSSGRSSSMLASSGRSSSFRSSSGRSSSGSGSSHNAIRFSGSSTIGNGNECWWSGCQPFTWAERGCYPSNQWRQHNIRNCAKGNEYYCCSTSE